MVLNAFQNRNVNSSGTEIRIAFSERKGIGITFSVRKGISTEINGIIEGICQFHVISFGECYDFSSNSTKI